MSNDEYRVSVLRGEKLTHRSFVCLKAAQLFAKKNVLAGAKLVSMDYRTVGPWVTMGNISKQESKE